MAITLIQQVLDPKAGKPHVTEPHYIRNDGLMWSEVAGDVVALDPAKGLCFGMEEVSAEVWHLLSERRSVDQLCNALQSRYQVDPDRCRKDVGELLDQMVAEGIARRVQ